MGYESALEAAGATVHKFKSFGSYQGDWWAKVTFNGQDGWAHGYFGSCSYCDAFDREFDYGYDCDEHRYLSGDKTGCAECVRLEADYNARLKTFGLRYLTELYTQEEAEKEASSNLEWDMDATAMLNWIKE